jgi:hypothetical protein
MEHMVSQPLMRSGGRNAEPDTNSLRVYFLTDTKFYELIFTWNDPYKDHETGKEMCEWQTMLLSSLRELPMNGFELMMMTDNVHDGNSSLLYISPQLREYEGTQCEPTRVGDMRLGLPKPILFVVPCFTTAEIHNRIEREGHGWQCGDYMQYYKGKAQQPPQPAEVPLTGDGGEPLFDVMPMNSWEERIAPKNRLTWPQANELIQQTDHAGGCIALRYYAEPHPPEGKVFDSLEWLNAPGALNELEPGQMQMRPAIENPTEGV